MCRFMGRSKSISAVTHQCDSAHSTSTLMRAHCGHLLGETQLQQAGRESRPAQPRPPCDGCQTDQRKMTMKSKLLVAALFAAGAATSASAADTYSLTINANVIGMCKFTQAAGS